MEIRIRIEEKPKTRIMKMRIAVPSQGENLEADVDPRFGRASKFLIVDSEMLDFIFGRPLIKTLPNLGINIRQEGKKTIITRSSQPQN